MAHRERDIINFEKLEQNAHAAMEADQKYWRENDAKFRAVHQKVASYEEFRDIVMAAHLKPLEKGEKINDTSDFVQPWNPLADKCQPEYSERIAKQMDNLEIRKLPSNAHEFIRDWRKYCKSPKDKYDFILKVGAENMSTIFKSEISFGFLGDLVAAMLDFQEEHADQVTAILKVLSQTGRFSLSLNFLSAKEQDNCCKLFGKLESVVDDDSQETLTELKDVYQIKK